MHANTYECGFKHSHNCWQMTARSSDQVFNAWLGLEEAAQDIKLFSTEDQNHRIIRVKTFGRTCLPSGHHTVPQLRNSKKPFVQISKAC